MSDETTLLLRKLLDERGVEYEAYRDIKNRCITKWCTYHGAFVFFAVEEEGKLFVETASDTEHSAICTPEQAIAATLGEKPRDKTEEWLLNTCNQAAQDYVAQLEQEVDELKSRLEAATLGSDDDYEAKMDALLCRLTNGKWSKSRAYDIDFMVSCVDEEYETLYANELVELGSGTCKLDYDRHCSNCGVYVHESAVLVRKDLDGGLWTVVAKPPNYCPNCGAKVRNE